MAKYSDKDIWGNNYDFLCFASSTILRPKDIHGDSKDKIAPMENMSALAKSLAEHDPRIPTALAGQFTKAKMIYEQTKLMPFISILIKDEKYISPFIVRRHTHDQVDPRLVLQSVTAMFRRIAGEATMNQYKLYGVERPIDAEKSYDRLVSLLPDNVTIHKEVRYE